LTAKPCAAEIEIVWQESTTYAAELRIAKKIAGEIGLFRTRTNEKAVAMQLWR
jgi:hypothetical protein